MIAVEMHNAVKYLIASLKAFWIIVRVIGAGSHLFLFCTHSYRLQMIYQVITTDSFAGYANRAVCSVTYKS